MGGFPATATGPQPGEKQEKIMKTRTLNLNPGDVLRVVVQGEEVLLLDSNGLRGNNREVELHMSHPQAGYAWDAVAARNLRRRVALASTAS